MGSGKGWPKSEGALLCMKYTLFAFNVVSFLLAIAIFALGLWARYEWDFKHFIYELHLEAFWTGIYILIVTSGIVMVISFFGCCGAIMENPTLLGIYAILLILCFLLELAGVATVLSFGTLWSGVTWWLRTRFYELIYNSDYNAREARILRIIQEEVGCCGSYSSLDYINVNKIVPFECRDKATGNEYLDGCYIRFSRFLEERSGWIAGVALLLIVLQLIGIIASCGMRSTLKKLDKEGKMYDPVKTSKA